MMTKKLIIGMVVGTVLINILGPLHGLSSKLFNTFKDIPKNMIIDTSQTSWFVWMMLSAVLLEVIIPTLFYAMIYKFLSVKGIYGGLLFGLSIFILGSLTQFVFTPMLIKLPIIFVVHDCFWQLLKYEIVLGVFGAIYV